jgi:hypothetical protein
LQHLVADLQNEIWITTRNDVMAIEDFYGCIPNLNFVGFGRVQLSKQNKASVDLPDGNLKFEDLEKEVSQLISGMSPSN